MLSISENETSIKSVQGKRIIYKDDIVYAKRWKKKNMQIRLSREYFLFLRQVLYVWYICIVIPTKFWAVDVSHWTCDMLQFDRVFWCMEHVL